MGGDRIAGREGLRQRLVLLVVVGEHPLQRHPEGGLGLGQRHAVLRALGPGDARHDVGEVELDRVAEGGLLGVLVVPQPLLPGVGLDQLELLGRAAGELQVADRLGVDREDRAGGAELGRHVADRGPVGQGQVGQPGAVELDELADHAALAQQLGHGQHQVGGGGALLQLAGQLEAEHLRDQHRHRLAEHRRLGLDPAHAPAQHAEAVDHRRVRVGADQRVGIGQGWAGSVSFVDEHHPGQVLEVDLVDDAGVGRDDAEVVEGLLAPAQERVALLVALELELGVALERRRGPEGVDLDRVVDDQLGGHERIDPAPARRRGRPWRRASRPGRRSPARR